MGRQAFITNCILNTIITFLFMATTFALYARPFFDSRADPAYTTILTVNSTPAGPLAEWVRKVRFSPLTSDRAAMNYTCPCGLALTLQPNCTRPRGEYTPANQIADVYAFLLNNGYHVECGITTLMQNSNVVHSGPEKMVCMVSYKG